MKKKFKDNIGYYFILGLLIIIVCLFFLNSYIKKEEELYKDEHDYTMASDIMSLSFNKNIYLNYEILKKQTVSTNLEHYSLGDLIYDFSKYNIIPSLNYLINKSEDEKLISTFNEFLGFIDDYNSLSITLAENIFTKNEDGYYYYKDNDSYIYPVKKKYISPKTFNKMYNEFIKKENIEEHFIKLLYEDDDINNKYSINEIKNYFNNNYEEFYKLNEDSIIKTIIKDINDFNNYLYSNYIKKEINQDGNIKRTIIREIESDEITINYKFKKLQRIYVSFSKYKDYSYQLDLEYLYNELKDYNIPILFM